MASPMETGLFGAFDRWIQQQSSVDAAILYGSSARAVVASAADTWSDFDLHVITSQPELFDTTDWPKELPGHGFCHQVKRAATGGTTKTTLLCEGGQIDLIVLSRSSMKLARFAFRVGLHRRIGFIRRALNEMSTSMRTGHRFIKGERAWAAFYADVVREMPGVRFDDAMVRHLADSFLVTMMLTLRRLERGEHVAAQDMLHRTLGETNFRLMRELRLRRGLSLPSFGLGRRAEQLLTPEELSWITIDARLDREQLRRAIWQAFAGLKALMGQIAPDWRVPERFEGLVAEYRPRV